MHKTTATRKVCSDFTGDLWHLQAQTVWARLQTLLKHSLELISRIQGTIPLIPKVNICAWPDESSAKLWFLCWLYLHWWWRKNTRSPPNKGTLQTTWGIIFLVSEY